MAGQGIFGDILSAAGAIPIAGSAVDLPRALAQAIQGKNPSGSLEEAIPGVGTAVGAGQIANSAGVNIGDIGKQLQSLLGSGSGGKSDPTNPVQATMNAANTNPQVAKYLQAQYDAAHPQGGQGVSNTDDALTMGLGMFFQQYLAPMMAQQSQTNNALNAQYGNVMQQALQNPLPPGVKSIMEASLPQTQQTLGMMNQAGLEQAAGTIPFEQLMSGLTAQTTATSALQDAFMKAATYQELGAGSPASLSAVLGGALGGPGSLGGALAQLLGGGSSSLLPTNPNVAAGLLGTAGGANGSAGSGYTPSQPTTTPTTG